MSKVVKVGSEGLEFDDGFEIYSYHDSDCCEHHWLDFSPYKVEDFEGMDFNLTSDKFFEKVEDYGIRLLPTNGLPVPVAGYGENNGYYSSDLSLVVYNHALDYKEVYDVSECQDY